MIYLITYDIECSRKRKEISNVLISYGFKRIQKSVFLSKENIMFIEKVIDSLNILLELREDSIIYMPLCSDDFDKSYFLGQNILLNETFYLEELLFL
ncbi:MAG: CRISPR-associated endonuclease Cas2 [Fusobacteriaceae bacterium]